MKYINLNGKYSGENRAIIDDEDYEKVSKHSWQVLKRPTKYKNKKYVRSTFYFKNNQKTMLLHRFVLNAPNDLQVDHINGDTLDNRKENLRLCTHNQNQMNQKIQIRNKYGYKGIKTHGDKWVARIGKDGKGIYIGIYGTKEEAAIAYNKKSIELFGEYANLNKVKFAEDYTVKV